MILKHIIWAKQTITTNIHLFFVFFTRVRNIYCFIVLLLLLLSFLLCCPPCPQGSRRRCPHTWQWLGGLGRWDVGLVWACGRCTQALLPLPSPPTPPHSTSPLVWSSTAVAQGRQCSCVESLESRGSSAHPCKLSSDRAGHCQHAQPAKHPISLLTGGAEMYFWGAEREREKKSSTTPGIAAFGADEVWSGSRLGPD